MQPSIATIFLKNDSLC